MNIAKFSVFFLLGAVAMGCVKDEAEEDSCDRRKFACMNSCYKAAQGAACRACCNDAFVGCKSGGSFSFYVCPDKDDP
jgi:hypothetical protein